MSPLSKEVWLGPRATVVFFSGKHDIAVHLTECEAAPVDKDQPWDTRRYLEEMKLKSETWA